MAIAQIYNTFIDPHATRFTAQARDASGALPPLGGHPTLLQLFTKLGSASRWGLFKAEDGLVRRARLARTLAEERYADLVSQVQLVEPQAWLLLEAVLELRDHGLGIHLCEDGAERAHLVRVRVRVRVRVS